MFGLKSSGEELGGALVVASNSFSAKLLHIEAEG
jgi:hypothetical protein